MAGRKSVFLWLINNVRAREVIILRKEKRLGEDYY